MKTLLIEYKDYKTNYHREDRDLYKVEKKHWPFRDNAYKAYGTYYTAHTFVNTGDLVIEVPEDLDIDTAWFKDMVVQMLPPTASHISVRVLPKGEVGRSTSKPVTIYEK